MTITYHWNFKTEDAVMGHPDGTVCVAQADFVGVCDIEDCPESIRSQAVTIRCSHERGTLQPADPSSPDYVQIEDLTPEIISGWLTAYLENEPGPRGLGQANMLVHYKDHIAECITSQRLQYDHEMSPDFVAEPKIATIKGFNDLATKSEPTKVALA